MIEQALANQISQSRTLQTSGLLAGIGAMTYAYYLQYYEYLAPCPLCIFDRVFLLGILLSLFAAIIHNPVRKVQRVYALVILLFTTGGLVTSGRHVWLQHLPADQVPACGPGLNYLLDTFPLFQTLEMVFRGSGECAEIAWQFLGFSLPEVTLLMFSAYLILSLIQLFRKSDQGLFSKQS